MKSNTPIHLNHKIAKWERAKVGKNVKPREHGTERVSTMLKEVRSKEETKVTQRELSRKTEKAWWVSGGKKLRTNR